MDQIDASMSVYRDIHVLNQKIVVYLSIYLSIYLSAYINIHLYI